jgi:hypothetical protein
MILMYALQLTTLHLTKLFISGTGKSFVPNLLKEARGRLWRPPVSETSYRTSSVLCA